MQAQKDKPGWLLAHARSVFKGLVRLTPRRLVLRQSAANDDCIEKWVLANLMLAACCFAAISFALFLLPRWCPTAAPLRSHVLVVAFVALCYGAWEVLEILVAQFTVLAVDPLEAGSNYWIVSHERSLVLALTNWGTVLFWFALAYNAGSFLFCRPSELANPLGALHASLSLMTLLGTSALDAGCPIGRCLVLVHMGIAYFMTVVVIAQAVGGMQRITTAELEQPGAEKDTGNEQTRTQN